MMVKPSFSRPLPILWLSPSGTSVQKACNCLFRSTRRPERRIVNIMQPKKEHIEYEENGARAKRITYDNSETKIHVEEV